MLRQILFFALVFQLRAAPDLSWADLLSRARELHGSGAHVAAEESYLAAAKEAKRLGHPTGLARIWKELATLYQDLSNPRRAEPLLLQALTTLKELKDPPASEIASVKHYLASGFRLQERFDEAERLHREVLKEQEQAFGADHGEVAESLHGLGMVYADTGRLQESVPVLERALTLREKFHGPASPQFANSLQVLAGVHVLLGDARRARREARRALAIREKLSGPGHVSVGIALNEVARAEYASGRYREATAIWERALTIMERWWGPKHRQSGLAAMNLGNGRRMENRFKEAEEILTHTTRVFEELNEKSLLGTSIYYLAMVHADQGNHAQAEAFFRRGLAVADAAMGTTSPHSGFCAAGLGRSLSVLGKLEEAEMVHRRGLAIIEKTFGAGFSELPDALDVQAMILRKLKRKSEAAEFEKRARSLRDGQSGHHWSRLTVDVSQLEQVKK